MTMAATTTKLKIRWRNLVMMVITVTAVMGMGGLLRVVEGASWCVARSNASEQALQTALDYACGAGADCIPIQSMGLCFLPNTLQAHASYAFNSYYQRRSLAPGACDFSGTATIAVTDPSYGSCVYPSSPSNAGGGTGGGVGGGTGGSIGGGAGGGIITPGTPSPTITNNPNTPPTTTSPMYGGGIGGYTPGSGPTTAGTTYGSQSSILAPSVNSLLVPLFPILFLSFLFKPYELL